LLSRSSTAHHPVSPVSPPLTSNASSRSRNMVGAVSSICDGRPGLWGPSQCHDRLTGLTQSGGMNPRWLTNTFWKLFPATITLGSSSLAHGEVVASNSRRRLSVSCRCTPAWGCISTTNGACKTGLVGLMGRENMPMPWKATNRRGGYFWGPVTRLRTPETACWEQS